jgi:uncharacterized protein YjbJ (UPF0337 family)
MAQLFQPFYRGAVKHSLQGLGLGLYIASEIARARQTKRGSLLNAHTAGNRQLTSTGLEEQTICSVLGSALSSNRIGKVMSGTSDKAAGVANEAIGKAKQGIGGAVGSDKMKGEGAVQEAKGDVQKAVGDAKNATKEAVDKTADAIKKPR